MCSALKKITLREIQNKPFSKFVLPYYHNGEYVIAEVNTINNVLSITIITKSYKDLKTLLILYELLKSPKPFLPYYILHDDITPAL